MLPEMNISSMLAIFILFGFVLMNYPQRNNFFTLYSIDGFLDLYTKILSSFIGLCLYVSFRMIPEAGPLESAIVSFVVAIGIGCFLEVQEYGKEDITIPDFLVDNIVFNEKHWVIGIMIVFLSVPFIGIFAVQSSFKLGIAWFYGILVIVYIIHVVTKGVLKGVDAFIHWATCGVNTEE